MASITSSSTIGNCLVGPTAVGLLVFLAPFPYTEDRFCGGRARIQCRHEI